MGGSRLLLVLALLVAACGTSQVPAGSLPPGGSFVVPTVSPAEQRADDRQVEDEVARCRQAAANRPPVIAAEDAPFLEEPVVPEGPFKGCMVDITRARPVTRVRDISVIRQPVLSPHRQLVMANFQHADSFWFAVVDLARVHEILVQMEHTGEFNHGQVRVTFQPGRDAVRLYPQGPPDSRSPISLDDITLTADGMAPIDVDRPANILPARQYPLLYRAMSTEQKVQIMSDAEGRLHSVEQFRILSDADAAQVDMADAFVTSWIEHGSRAQFHVMFQLIPLPPSGSLNCTSALFQVLDETVAHPDPGWRARVLDEFIPSHIPTYLMWRGYAIDQIREPDLNVQLGLPGTPEFSSPGVIE